MFRVVTWRSGDGFILVVLALNSFHCMLQLITILNFYEGSLTPDDENERQPWSGGNIEVLGKAEAVIGGQSRILNWPCSRDGTPIGAAQAARGARSL